MFIVEPKEGVKADREYTLVLDEWQSNPNESMQGMNHGDSQTSDMENHKQNQNA